MSWAWYDDKNHENIQKHGIRFESDQHVLDDTLQVTEDDPNEQEQRFRTTGMLGNMVIVAIHTLTAHEDATTDERGRIISARYPTPRERREYEQSR